MGVYQDHLDENKRYLVRKFFQQDNESIAFAVSFSPESLSSSIAFVLLEKLSVTCSDCSDSAINHMLPLSNLQSTLLLHIKSSANNTPLYLSSISITNR